MLKYKVISDTFIFEQSKSNIMDTIQGSLAQGKALGPQDLEEQFVLIKKYIKSALKIKVLKDYEENNIVLLYAPENVGRMTSLPFIMSVSNGKLCANVMVSSFGNMRQDGVVNVDYRKLYTLMESAYIAKEFLGRYDKYKNNGAIINGCVIYANMFVKPLNKKFNLHLDKNRENAVLFLAAKFYLKNVLGMQNEDILYNTAIRACKGENPLLIKEVDVAIPDEAYKDLGTFINALKEDKLNLGLSGLTVRGFLESYISLYGGSTVFGLELLPYWLYIVNASISSMGLVNNYALEELCEKGGAKIIAQFLN